MGAKNAEGVSAWSGVWTFTTIIAAPGVPQLASPSSGATNVMLPVALSWNTSTNAATYAVQVSTDADFGSTVTAQIGLTGTSASIIGLAKQCNLLLAGWSEGCRRCERLVGRVELYDDRCGSGAPVLASPSNGAGNQPITSLSLSWGTSALATSYEVEVSLSSAFRQHAL